MLCTLLISYPFIAQEKSNLDALYTILSITRKTVVLGRYFSILLLNLCCLAFSFVFAKLGVLGAKAAGIFQTGGRGSLAPFLALSALFILIQAVQLPIYFKLGYAKAKFMSIVPYAVLISGYSAFISLSKDSGVAAEFSAYLTKILGSGALPALIAVLALALAAFASYSLSLAAYRKREF
jgi:hypothetical protein